MRADACEECGEPFEFERDSRSSERFCSDRCRYRGLNKRHGQSRVRATAAVPWSALPEPMLAKSWKLPTRGAWAYEVKWDGFRAIVSTEGPLRVRSRRGWNMTEHVGFLEQLPVRAVLDGELVAFGNDGKPDFERVCERMLHRHVDVPLT